MVDEKHAKRRGYRMRARVGPSENSRYLAIDMQEG